MSYERAVSMHTAAREMVYVAEQGLLADGKNTLDPTWQEMLNHATAKVTEKSRSGFKMRGFNFYLLPHRGCYSFTKHCRVQ